MGASKFHLKIAFFRYDKTNSQCGHMECSYFLSYTYKKTPEQTEYEFDMELSGRSSGWIAVGFSSDQQMVTACHSFPCLLSLIMNAIDSSFVARLFNRKFDYTSDILFSISASFAKGHTVIKMQG